MSRDPTTRPDIANPLRREDIGELFRPLWGQPLALSVSGGADSMALLYLVAEWLADEAVAKSWQEAWAGLKQEQIISLPPVDGRGCAPPRWLDRIGSTADIEARGGPPHVLVVSVDHGLRAGSADDAAFVAEEARKLGLFCEVLRWRGAKPATGIQNAARCARYRLIGDLLRAESAAVARFVGSGQRFLRSVVTAHHQDDQAETFVMRLARGSGLEGLGAMAERRPAGSWPLIDAPILRPLLAVPKARLRASLKARGVNWIEDPSNSDEGFERVRVRQTLGGLAQLGMSADSTALSARRLRSADAAFEQMLRALLPERPLEWRFGLQARMVFPWALCSEYAMVRVLRTLIRQFGGAASDPELAQVESLVERYWRNDPDLRRGVTLAGCQILVQHENNEQPQQPVWSIHREVHGAGLETVDLEARYPALWDNRFWVTAAECPPGSRVEALGPAGWACLRRRVPELECLSLQARVMATLPVVRLDGSTIAHPLLGQYLHARRDVLDGPLVRAWQAYAETLSHDGRIMCRFIGADT